MNILYIITGLGLGGAEKVVVDLADQMTSHGHQVSIVYLKGEALVKPKSKNIDLVCLNFDTFFDLLSASKKYKKIIKKFNPDVVHAHMVHANIFSRVNRLSCNIPKLICTAHNSNEGGKLRMLAYKVTNFLSDLNTNVSLEASVSLINKGAFSKKNLITIYNGIDLNKFKFENVERGDDKIISFLSVGRFNDQKDYPNLLHAISFFKCEIKEKVHFFIAGDGELRLEIEMLIKELNLENIVTLLGKRADIPALLNKADFFVLPSKHEGLPTVIIEAMACQTYVITTDCGGSKEIIGDTGKLVPKQNSELLAQAMEEALLLTPQQLEENGKRARKRVEDIFSLETSVDNWLKIYEQK